MQIIELLKPFNKEKEKDYEKDLYCSFFDFFGSAFPGYGRC
jgi:hypothetical protein